MKQALVIARREITTRLRSKALIVVVVGICVLAVLAGVVVRLAAGAGYLDSSYRLALSPQTQPYQQLLAATGKQTTMLDVKFTRASSSRKAQQMVRDGDVDAALIEDNGHLVLVSDSQVSYGTQMLVTYVAAQQTVATYVTELGGNTQQLGKRLAQSRVQVRQLDKPSEKDSDDPEMARVFGAAAIMLILFMAILVGSQFVANSVVEEKSSRVIEVLLAAVRPTRLLTAKVVSMCLLVVVGAALVLASAAGGLYISGYASALKLNGFSVSLWALLFGVVGFLSYGFVYGGLAALVSRQEDLPAATMPITLIAVVAVYVPYFTTLWNPSSPVTEVVSFVPLFSCFAAPLLIAMGAMPISQVLISLAISIVFLVAVIFVAARMYRNSVLHFGRRRRLLQALRGVR